MMLSAVILTHHEKEELAKCLESVKFCDEIILVADRPVGEPALKIAGVKTYARPLDKDFAAQRNFGLQKAQGDWVLFVDADEIVSPALATEITAAVNNAKPEIQGYFLTRTDYFWGRRLEHGETAKIRLLRLARRAAGVWQRSVHEFWAVTGATANLHATLDHFPHPTVHEFLDSVNFYTEIDAIELPKEHKGFSVWRLLLNPIGKFLQNYCLRLGCLDGAPGLVVSCMMSLYSLIVRVKIWERSYGVSASV